MDSLTGQILAKGIVLSSLLNHNMINMDVASQGIEFISHQHCFKNEGSGGHAILLEKPHQNNTHLDGILYFWNL